MIIETVESIAFRNLNFSEVCLSEKFNLVLGANASGKTSFLEAIHLGLTGKSFRTPNFKKYIHNTESECWVALTFRSFQHDTIEDSVPANQKNIDLGTVATKDGSRKVGCSDRLTVKRNKVGQSRITLNGQLQESFLKTVGILPLVVLAPDLATLVDASSKERRQYLDWSVFHVKHLFRKDWAKYQYGLKQRNSLLKQSRLNIKELDFWNHFLSDAGNSITEQRISVFGELEKVIVELTESNPELSNLAYKFYPGWNSERADLLSTLKNNQTKDRQIGYTSQGPHRADIKSYLKGKEAKDILSRGQRKWLTYCMKLAQVKLTHLVYGKNTLVLIDDFNSELDLNHQSLVLNLLKELGSQVVLTAIEDSSFKQHSVINNEYKMFHVKQGNFSTIL